MYVRVLCPNKRNIPVETILTVQTVVTVEIYCKGGDLLLSVDDWRQ